MPLCQDDNVSISFRLKEEDNNCLIEMSVTNKRDEKVEEMVFQCAVLKYLRLQMMPISGHHLTPLQQDGIQQVLSII